MEFKEYKLDDVCLKITDGSHYSPKNDENSKISMLSVKDMLTYDFNYNDCKHISEEEYNKMKRNDCVPKIGDVLVAKDGSYLKEIFVNKRDNKKAILSSIAIFRPNTSIILPEYLCYLLKSPKVYNYTRNNCVSGSALPRIILKSFKNIPIEIATIENQTKIVNILSKLDKKIQLNNQINNNLNKIMKLNFNQWVENIKDYELSNLSSIANYKNGLAMQKYRPVNEDGLPVIKIKEMNSGISSDTERCRSNIDKDVIVNNGDILFAWSGTLCMTMWSGGKAGLNQHIFKVTSEQYPKWFYYFWTLKHLDNFIQIAAGKATTMGHIKREELDKSIVYIPNKEELNNMNKLMEPLMDKFINNKIENNKLEQLRNTLLPKLMNGEINLDKVEL